MRPITLRIEGFRSFGTETPTTIEFGDRDLIAIVGDTGAGKSSILEAMTYSLYGQTSFAGNANQEVVNDQSPYCEVALRFWADSYEWIAHRRLDRKRSGEVGKATAVLTKHGDDDEPIETTEGVHQVNRRTAELLGLDAPAFLRTMVLPQGRFARLLQAREEVARLRSIRKPVEQLLRLHGQVTEHEGRLKEVADGLRASRFPKWLTLRRSTNLPRHGSQQLEKMSGGRYAFADPRETAEEWKVIDRWSGAARLPASLSGGEQFMAALALSLGMVETMGERGGRLECMFLDEGFGTLDRQSLDEAVEALYAGSQPDHMIGVITHVREVAERMPAVLKVERQPGRGSRAEWLAESERHERLRS